jgi:dCMP deaminase
MSNRISWDEYALRIAQVAALRSEDPYRKVGACGLDNKNRVVGVAYNGLAAGINVGASFWADRDARLPYMIHAETNLMALLRKGECHTVACTLMPCQYCAAMLVAHGVNRIIYLEEYSRDNGKASEIFRFNGVDCYKYDLPPITI